MACFCLFVGFVIVVLVLVLLVRLFCLFVLFFVFPDITNILFLGILLDISLQIVVCLLHFLPSSINECLYCIVYCAILQKLSTLHDIYKSNKPGLHCSMQFIFNLLCNFIIIVIIVIIIVIIAI